MLNKYIAYLLCLLFCIQNMKAQDCSSNQTAMTTNSTCGKADALSSADQSLIARDKVTLTAGFSLSNNNTSHQFTIKTDNAVIPDVATCFNGVNSTLDASTRALDKSLVPGSLPGDLDVDVMGALQYSVPIAVSPGAKGMVPSLSIDYSSKGGNGLLGYGFQLGGLSEISRDSKNPYYDGKYAPISLSENPFDDALLLDGQRLIANPKYAGRYSPENDPYTLVTYNSSSKCFTVADKDGFVSQYGYTSDSRFKSAENSTAVLTWAINRHTDPYGNFVDYKYNRFANGENLISRIEYTGNSTYSAAALNYILFKYDKRSDVESYKIAGNTVYKQFVLSGIQVMADGALSKDYVFDYTFDGLHTKLKAISLTADGVAYNPTVFNWGSPEIDETFPSDNYGQMKDHDLYFGDLDGDGDQDMIKFSTSTGTAIINDVSYAFGVTFEQVTDSKHVYEKRDLAVMDINRDGKDEILFHCVNKMDSEMKDIVYVFSFNGSNIGQINVIRHSLPQAKTNAEYYYKHFYLDADGDGYVEDIVCVRDNSVDEHARCQNIKTLNDTEYQYSTTTLSNVIMDDVKVMDYDGDGLSEFFAMANGGEGYMFKFANNTFTSLFTYDFGKPADDFVGDFNGDGKSDILFFMGGSWYIAYSTGKADGTNPFNLVSLGTQYLPNIQPSLMGLEDTYYDTM